MKIQDSFLLISNFNNDLEWLKEYSENYLIYDQHEASVYPDFIDKTKIIKRDHIGADIYDKLSWIIDKYYELPEVFLMLKGNLFKYITKKEFDEVCNNKTFTPLLTKNHKIYNDYLGPICFYSGDIYNERNDSWYLNTYPSKYFNSYKEFADSFQLPNPFYLPFAPGANYIVTKENVHKYSKDFYEHLASVLTHASYSGEAQMIERSLYTIFK